ncbi:heavy metal-associated isoprenylated plant protein 41-like isoform X2 [Henckelia pumila]|uniref:heavy metal-associated isoprenylated plant protein 41-like isoform X2 n=1 Tax=Henckelia pumila TaxID=405737 RepID=UPI003C6E22D5
MVPDQLIQKYKNAETNVRYLEILGGTLIYEVDATSLNVYSDLQYQKFHRIIYNFPHVGFLGREDDPTLIDMHRKLVRGFFWDARRMLMVDGEIHINHKVAPPYNQWRIEDLACECDLFLVGLPVFSIKHYPGYQNKRGSGANCDMPFNLGACRTFKFKLYLGDERILEHRSTLGLIHKMPAEFQEVPILEQHQAPPPPLKRLHPLGYDHVPQLVKQQTSNILISNECHMVFAPYLKYVEETFGSETSHPLNQSVSEALKTGFRTYISSVPGATSSGYIGILEELRNLSIHRSEMLRQMLANQVHADPHI